MTGLKAQPNAESEEEKGEGGGRGGGGGKGGKEGRKERILFERTKKKLPRNMYTLVCVMQLWKAVKLLQAIESSRPRSLGSQLQTA